MNSINVLFVDDEAILQGLTKTYLERNSDFSVDTASDGEEALQMLEKKKYDAVVSDYQMPVLDGIGLLKKIRENKSNIPFIIFTGKGREEIAIEALNSGADYYIQKGGDPSSLYDILVDNIQKAVEVRRVEEERLRMLSDLEELINACTHFTAIVNPDLTIRFINEKGKRNINDYYDYSGDFIGKSLYQIFPEEFVEENVNRYKTALEERHQVSFDYEMKDVIFEIQIAPHFSSDGDLRFYSYFQEIKSDKNN